MLASGRVARRGIVPPEDAVVGDLYPWFLAELEKREIRIAEVVSEG